jgi:hypothetical protein
MQRHPYVWLFVALWAIAVVAFWLLMDWNAYYDTGQGRKVEFWLPVWLQLPISAAVVTFAATMAVVLGMFASYCCRMIVSVFSARRPN